jgi:ribonuclease HII
MQPDFSIENIYPTLISLGIDEAGRGPLAGPVVAACAIVDQNNFSKKIDDSKKLSSKQRREIYIELLENTKFGIGVVDAPKIDEINILNATKLAMHLALLDLQKKYQIFPQIILVDGNFIPFKKQDKIIEIIPIIKGDQKSLSIAAASIIAKEFRDDLMLKIDQEYPQFGFKKHMGYPTKFHVEKIKEFGICQFHRKSFQPIKSMFHEGN